MNLITIERHIAETQRRFPEARGNFSALMSNIAFAAKIISSAVNRAGLVDILGETGDENVQGERVKKLDRYADETLVRVVGGGGQVCAMASEEREDVIHIPDGRARGRYVLVFDPLDGSSNIDVNVTVGSIFGTSYCGASPFSAGSSPSERGVWTENESRIVGASSSSPK